MMMVQSPLDLKFHVVQLGTYLLDVLEDVNKFLHVLCNEMCMQLFNEFL